MPRSWSAQSAVVARAEGALGVSVCVVGSATVTARQVLARSVPRTGLAKRDSDVFDPLVGTPLVTV